jgi:hypothetical protein
MNLKTTKNNKKMRNLMFILIFGFVLSILLPLPKLIGTPNTLIVLGIILVGITILENLRKRI